jgi:hypothetical protein
MGARNDTMNPPRFALATAVTGDATVGLTVSGEPDIATVGQFATVLQGIPTNLGRTRVVLDFAPLTVLDVNGVSALHIVRHSPAARHRPHRYHLPRHRPTNPRNHRPVPAPDPQPSSHPTRRQPRTPHGKPASTGRRRTPLTVAVSGADHHGCQ